MSKLRRHFVPGDVYFLTCVTLGRKPILLDYAPIFLSVLDQFRRTIPFDLIAFVILRDHLHLILDPLKSRPDLILQRVKLSFTSRVQASVSIKRASLWQRRYWDHKIRDQRDLNRHLDYIHFNPVKHGLVDDPANWEYSSYRTYVEQGYYPENWARAEKPVFEGEFGE